MISFGERLSAFDCCSVYWTWLTEEALAQSRVQVFLLPSWIAPIAPSSGAHRSTTSAWASMTGDKKTRLEENRNSRRLKRMCARKPQIARPRMRALSSILTILRSRIKSACRSPTTGYITPFSITFFFLTHFSLSWDGNFDESRLEKFFPTLILCGTKKKKTSNHRFLFFKILAR